MEKIDNKSMIYFLPLSSFYLLFYVKREALKSDSSKKI